jgi:hypothetical protein
MEVRGLDDDDTLTVTRNGEDVSSAFSAPDDGEAGGVVTGLVVGANDVTATASGPAGTRTATLEVINHPITGPVISGPHQVPFTCETEQAGLGEPLDDDCSARPRVEWWWRNGTGTFAPLTDPYGAYPAETTTATTRDGRTVPFVVRVESRTINRSITRMAVLDDPAARGRGVPYAPTAGWNGSVVHQFGESCGTGYHQGQNSVETVLGSSGLDPENLAGVLVQPAARLGEGYLWTHSTLTIFGVHCNQVLTAETTMMVKEHIIEAYGPIENVLGVGASGGALQQYTVIDGYPGLLDIGVPIVSFPDVVSTAMTTVDCGLLGRVFEEDPDRFPDLLHTTITGLATDQQCQDWINLFLDNIHPSRGCSGAVPDEQRYDPVSNRTGARCTVQDTAVNVLGRDPETGFALRPLDNAGVQYGWRALQQGVLSLEDFIVLNQRVGGFDIDGNWVPERMTMSPELATRVYRYGGVTGHGEPESTPIIDIRLYVDLIPILGFHDQIRPYIFEARLATEGHDDSLAIWNGLPLPPAALRVGHLWAERIDAAYEPGEDRADIVAAVAPPEATDRCVAPDAIELAGQYLGPLPLIDIPGCDPIFELAAASTTRMAAGGPATDDIIKCTMRPLNPGDYPGATPAQLDALRAVFPDGVCDWSRPGVGQNVEQLTWASVGGDDLAAEPFAVTNIVARSTSPAVATADTRSLPPTGGGPGSTPLWLLVVAVAAVAASRMLSPGRGRRAAR